MLKYILKRIKVISKHLVIAFLFASFILFFMFVLFGKRINTFMSLVNKFVVFNDSMSYEKKDIKIDDIEKRLIVYPSYGEVIGSIEIPSVDINVALYHGESLKILKYGAGHHAGSYFPGEGGTVIIAGHNTLGYFYSLPNIKINDEIVIKTVYGIYEYKVKNMYVIDAKTLGSNLKIESDRETIMIYTCYPVEIPGYKSKRFVVIGDLIVGDNNE